LAETDHLRGHPFKLQRKPFSWRMNRLKIFNLLSFNYCRFSNAGANCMPQAVWFLNQHLVHTTSFCKSSHADSEKTPNETKFFHLNGDRTFSGLFNPFTENQMRKPKTKVSVIGSGSVGAAIAFSIMTQSISDALALIDCDEKRVTGELLDLQQCSQFVDHCFISGGKGKVIRYYSRFVQIILIRVVPEIVKHSPNCIIVVVSNPVDILTHAVWRLSGFPKHRVLGSGTLLDSARFRYLIGRKFGIAPASVHAYIIGEHGDSSVAVWSKISVGGLNLADIYPKFGHEDDPKRFADIHRDVASYGFLSTSAYKIIQMKGYTSWAIGLSCATLCNALLHDRHTILPVSTNVKGLFGIDYEVFLSMPCVISSGGVMSIVNLDLSEKEMQMFKTSAGILHAASSGLLW
uniref:L-lactate dehydrogenase n=1 Tax=Schistocephalus solidus TaxID=70667 RepID=A0A183SQF1_SCHSO